MSDIDSASVETDDELLLSFQVEINRYLNSPQRVPLKIVTVGQGRVGKSTLINNILNLQGDNEAKAEWSANPVTRGVTEYSNVVNGVPICMYDTPGLMDDGIDEKEVIKDIRDQTQGSISLLLYVSSLSNRLNKTDKEIIKVLTEEFTPQIWKNSIVVLSFANEHCQKMAYAECTHDTAMVFQQFLRQQNGCDHYILRCLHTNDDIDEQYDIPAIPTGQYKDCLPEMWYQILLTVMLRHCHNECFFALMLATSKLLNDTEIADASGIGDVVVGGPAIEGLDVGGPAVGGPADGDPAVGGPTIGGPDVGGLAVGGPPIGGPSDGDPAVGGPADGDPAVGGPSIGGPAYGDPAVGGPPIGGPPIGGPADGDPAVGGPADGDPAVGGLPLGGPSDGDPAVGGPADGDPTVGDAAIRGAAIGGAAIGGGAGTFVALGTTSTTAYVTSSTAVASIMTAIGVKTPVTIVTSASLIPSLTTVVSSTALVAGAATGVVGGAVLGIGISYAVLKYIRSRQQT